MIRDIEQIRSFFPYLQSADSGGRTLIYFDNAATTQKPRIVINAVSRWLVDANANVHRAVYGLAATATEHYEAGREAARALINAASKDEIVLTSGTTASINLLANVYGQRYIKPGDEILLSEGEHHSNLVPWQMLCERTGARLRYFPVMEDGQWDLEAAEKILAEGKVRMVSAAHISNVLGIVNPVGELTALAHRYGAHIHLDGAQGIVHAGIDVQSIPCDFYSFSGHKIYAMTGTGVLYGRRSLLETLPPWMGGGEMVDTVTYGKTTYADIPLRFEAGTPNFLAAATLRPAIDFATSVRIAQVHKNEEEMTEYLMRELNSIDGMRIIGSGGKKVPLISFNVEGVHHSDIATLLDKMGIAVRSGQMCSEPLLNKFGQTGAVRVSLAAYNTMRECEAFIAALHRVLKMLK